jgi:hypothetical protein
LEREERALERGGEERDEVFSKMQSLLFCEIHLVQDVMIPIQQKQQTVLHTSTTAQRKGSEAQRCGRQTERQGEGRRGKEMGGEGREGHKRESDLMQRRR